MGKINKAKFDADTGHPWDDVMNRADELFEELRQLEYSSQDIAHIGLRLTHLGNFAWIIEGTEYMEKRVNEQICK